MSKHSFVAVFRFPEGSMHWALIAVVDPFPDLLQIPNSVDNEIHRGAPVWKCLSKVFGRPSEVQKGHAQAPHTSEHLQDAIERHVLETLKTHV